MKKRIYGYCALVAGLLGGCTQNVQVPVHTPVPAVNSPSQYVKYVVRPGDTLSAIASQYQVSYLALARLNNIQSPYPVYSGQILNVPNPAIVAERVAMQSHAFGGKTEPVKIQNTIQGQQINLSQDNATASANSESIQNGATSGKVYVAPLPVQALPTTNSNARARAIARQLVTQNTAPSKTSMPLSTNPLTPVKTSSAALPAINVSPEQKRTVAGVVWSWPLSGAVAEGFGKGAGELGKGVQVAATANTKVLAAADGSVIYSGVGTSDYGKMVIIKSDNNFLTAYTHLSTLFVKQGQAVSRGNVIGIMGVINGRPMLHFELRKFGNPVDPSKYLPIETQQ